VWCVMCAGIIECSLSCHVVSDGMLFQVHL